jgi:hypothetical protein
MMIDDAVESEIKILDPQKEALKLAKKLFCIYLYFIKQGRFCFPSSPFFRIDSIYIYIYIT